MSVSPLHVMHFPAILRMQLQWHDSVHLSSVYTDYSFSSWHTVKGKSQNCRVVGGLTQPQCYIFDQKRTAGVRLTWGLSRGRTSLLLPPGAENPSYATGWIGECRCVAVDVHIQHVHCRRRLHSPML